MPCQGLVLGPPPPAPPPPACSVCCRRRLCGRFALQTAPPTGNRLLFSPGCLADSRQAGARVQHTLPCPSRSRLAIPTTRHRRCAQPPPAPGQAAILCRRVCSATSGLLWPVGGQAPGARKSSHRQPCRNAGRANGLPLTAMGETLGACQMLVSRSATPSQGTARPRAPSLALDKAYTWVTGAGVVRVLVWPHPSNAAPQPSPKAECSTRSTCRARKVLLPADR